MARKLDHAKLKASKRSSTPLTNEGFLTTREQNNADKAAAVKAAKKRQRLYLIADVARKLNG
tara:strand:+ start:7144 stop:7329 length:186 start_codon:yes stop_codon:yes gene_type:complete